MSKSHTPQWQVDSFRRFLQIFPHERDRELVILKGHLLIEEQINKIISERLHDAADLEKLDLGCAQAVELARALVGDKTGDELWDLVKKLNKIRNKIAHNVEPSGLEDRIIDLVDTCPIDPSPFDNDDLGFEWCLWNLFVWVTEYVEQESADVIPIRAPQED